MKYLALIAIFLLLPQVPRWFMWLQNVSKGSEKETAKIRAALKTLEVPASASEDEIKAAHKRLIQKNHPDAGGSRDIAAKINEARDILLKNVRS